MNSHRATADPAAAHPTSDGVFIALLAAAIGLVTWL